MTQKNNNAPQQDLLQELRNFIGVQTNEVYVKKSIPFEAITDGLGLESPKKTEAPTTTEKKLPVIQTASEVAEKKLPPPIPSKKTTSLQETLKSAEIKNTNPPALPQATYGRRFMASIVDHLLVLTLLFFSLGLGIRWGVLSADSIDISNFQNFSFLSKSVQIYFLFWFVYLVLVIGFLDSTIGMRLLGLQLKFGPHQDAKGLKKTSRILLSAISHALVVPNIFLLFHHRGKNFLDTLSSTQVYRTA